MTEKHAASSDVPAEDPLDLLRRRIKRLHLHSGEPSTRQISARTNRAISHTTVHSVLRCTKLPQWGQLELVVEQLGGSVQDFRDLWIRVRAARDDTAENIETAGLDDEFERDLRAPGIRMGEEGRAGQGNSSTQLLSDLISGVLDDIEKVSARATGVIATGFTDLDRLTNGIAPGQLVVIAGRPAIGKSSFALSIGRSVAVRQGLPTLLMSFRLPKAEVVTRLLSAESRIPLHVLRSGQLSDDDWTKLARRLGEIVNVPIFVNDTFAPSLGALTEEAHRAVADDGTKLIVVDSIQQLLEMREPEMNGIDGREVSRSLKHLAHELGIAIVAVSGLDAHKKSGMKAPPPPQLQDLDGIDDDADLVFAIHRDDHYDYESPRAGEADIFVLKNRNGPLDVVTVAAQLHLCRYVDMAIV